MQESRESLVCLQNTSSLMVPPISAGDKLSSLDLDSSTPFKVRTSKAASPIKNTGDVLHYQDDRVVSDTCTEETLSDATSDQEIKTCDLSVIDISTGCKGVRRCATFPRAEGQVTVPKSDLGGQEAVMEPLTHERSKSLPVRFYISCPFSFYYSTKFKFWSR
jgi:hypothetical protein